MMTHLPILMRVLLLAPFAHLALSPTTAHAAVTTTPPPTPPPPRLSMVAFGTGSRGCSPPAACTSAVATALRQGWRSIDAAYESGTQAEVAAGIAASGVRRSDLFLETKIPGPVGAEAAAATFEADLRALKVPSVDLLLMHYPCTDDFPQPRDGCTIDQGADARRETGRPWSGW